MSDLILTSRPKFSRHLFRGRTIGVTGCAKGIGRATVLSLGRLGANVVMIDVNRKGLRAVRTEIEEAGGTAVDLVGDISDEAFLTRCIRKAKKTFGGMHGWVNNAMTTRQGLVADRSTDDLRHVLEVNVVAAWNACKLGFPHIADAGGGAVVNLSSVMASIGAEKDTTYITSKAAVEGMTRALATEYAPMRIRVNAVAPGLINTVNRLPIPDDLPPKVRKEMEEIRFRLTRDRHLQFTRLPYGGEPQHVADAILFLLSDASAFVNGVVLRVDGGYLSDYKLHPMREPERTQRDRDRADAIRNQYSRSHKVEKAGST